MIITYYGQSCFKITSQGGHLTLITDPFDKKIGLTPPRASADIVLVSHNHSDHSNVSAVSGSSAFSASPGSAGGPFIINGPGEYEVKGVEILGISSFHDKQKGVQQGPNTIYLMKIDSIRVCHMGDFGEDKLSDKQLEALGETEILMIPVGGTYTISAKEAVRIVHQLEPKIVIPMHYKLPGTKLDIAGANEFLQEMGVEKKRSVDKLAVKNKDLAEKDMEVVVMKP